MSKPEVICKVCSKLFVPRVKTQNICSKECRSENNKAYQQEWYEKNRTSELEKRKFYMTDWRKKNPGQTYRKGTTALYHGAKERALKNGIEFTITPLDIVIPWACPILGKEMVRPGRYAPSLDRIDPAKGYTPDNIWVISKLANRMKNDATLNELKDFAAWAQNL